MARVHNGHCTSRWRTWIAVYDALDFLASGMTSDQIVSDFPEFTGEQVRAVIEFAAMRERRFATPA